MKPGATSYQIMGPQNRKVCWQEIWSEGTDAVMDVPVGGVCEVLYSQERNDDLKASSQADHRRSSFS